MYQQTTKSITITVEPSYLEEESNPDEFHFVWAYHITIENNGADRVQLLRRRWHITDSNGHVQEVRGEGVVGEQPVLDPGESFEYTSGAPLSTPSGFMVGSYLMVSESGGTFDVSIPAFSLDSPYHTTAVN